MDSSWAAELRRKRSKGLVGLRRGVSVGSLEIPGIVVSLEIPGIVVSLEIPVSGLKSFFFIVKPDMFIVKIIRRNFPKCSYI